jgi:putative hydrolase of the HAD superfamily
VSVPSGLALVAFDLDNTLYDEGLWFAAALPPIAAYLAARSGRPEPEIQAFLCATLRAKGRHYNRLFDDALREVGLPRDPHLAEILAIFREAPTALEPFPAMRELLRDLAERYRLGLITSGQAPVQARKLELLGIRPLFASVIFSSTLPENKPGRMPFERLLAAVGVEPARAAYVGDNPLFDFRGANLVGMLTIRVPNPELDGLVVPEGWDARLRVTGLPELRALLLRQTP